MLGGTGLIDRAGLAGALATETLRPLEHARGGRRGGKYNMDTQRPILEHARWRAKRRER